MIPVLATGFKDSDRTARARCIDALGRRPRTLRLARADRLPYFVERSFAEHRDAFGERITGWFRDLDPRAAAAEATLVGEIPRPGQARHAHQREADAGAFLIVEAFAKGVLGPQVEWLQRNDLVPVAEHAGRHQFGEVFDHDLQSLGVDLRLAPSDEGSPTARSQILITEDGLRTMNTYLGACTEL